MSQLCEAAQGFLEKLRSGKHVLASDHSLRQEWKDSLYQSAGNNVFLTGTLHGDIYQAIEIYEKELQVIEMIGGNDVESN